MANDDVHIRRKVTLRKKSADDPAPEAENPKPVDNGTGPLPPTPDPGPTPSNVRKSNNKPWIWWLIGLAVVAAIVLICVKSCDSPKTDGTTETGVISTVEPETGAMPADSVAAVSPEGTSDVTPDEEVATNSDDAGVEGLSDGGQPQDTPTPASVVADPVPPTPATVSISTPQEVVEKEALNVIRGDYGWAPDRYELLRKLGVDPMEVQRRVNQMKREGLF